MEILTGKEMDEQVQAVIYQRDTDSFIAHHDRPYVVNLWKLLSVRKMSFDELYRIGVFGLSDGVKPYSPMGLAVYEKIEEIPVGNAVILSPYAKSVANFQGEYWDFIAGYCSGKGYRVYTNVVREEKELAGTIRLETRLNELQSVVERAGIFIGVRNGLCDVLREAKCWKIALYPDCFYSSTGCKVEEVFHLDGWENIVVKDVKNFLSICKKQESMQAWKEQRKKGG